MERNNGKQLDLVSEAWDDIIRCSVSIGIIKDQYENPPSELIEELDKRIAGATHRIEASHNGHKESKHVLEKFIKWVEDEGFSLVVPENLNINSPYEQDGANYIIKH